jgi:hypothetical protein
MDDVGSDLSCSDVVASSSDEDENSLMDELVLFVDTDENDCDDDSHSSLPKNKKHRTTSSLASETSSGESTGQFFDDFSLMRRMDFSRIEERGFHVAYLCFDRKGLHNKQSLCFGQVRASAYGPDSFVLKSMMIPQDPHRLLTTSYHAQEIPSYTFVPILIEFVRVVGVRFEEGECRVNSFLTVLIVFHHLRSANSAKTLFALTANSRALLADSCPNFA